METYRCLFFHPKWSHHFTRKTKDEIGQVEIENKYIVLTSYQIESYLREEKENEERKFEQENDEKGESRNDENE